MYCYPFQTYREVPLYGQILLWLPAGAAVTSVLTKFIWAMCHSQRKRINAALDGTKTKMVDQLGFMSKVKNEVTMTVKVNKTNLPRTTLGQFLM